MAKLIKFTKIDIFSDDKTTSDIYINSSNVISVEGRQRLNGVSEEVTKIYTIGQEFTFVKEKVEIVIKMLNYREVERENLKHFMSTMED
jgi:hypothetical protein